MCQSILLGIKLTRSFIDGLWQTKSFKQALAYSILLQFINITKFCIDFFTIKREQKELIVQFIKIGRLVDNSVESRIINVEDVGEMLTGVSQSTGLGIVSKPQALIFQVVNNLKNLSIKNQHYNDFTQSLIKSWKANELRIYNNGSIANCASIAKKNSEDSGGWFFIAFVYLLNPVSFTEDFKKIIYLCGAWFQILDDYRDRKKDKTKAITLFTTQEDKCFKQILKKQLEQYKTEIDMINTCQGSSDLVKFMNSLTKIIKAFDFTKNINIIDW